MLRVGEKDKLELYVKLIEEKMKLYDNRIIVGRIVPSHEYRIIMHSPS